MDMKGVCRSINMSKIVVNSVIHDGEQEKYQK